MNVLSCTGIDNWRKLKFAGHFLQDFSKELDDNINVKEKPDNVESLFNSFLKLFRILLIDFDSKERDVLGEFVQNKSCEFLASPHSVGWQPSGVFESVFFSHHSSSPCPALR